MRSALIIPFILLGLSAYGQDWLPFQPDMKYLYQYSTLPLNDIYSEDSTYETYFIDSVSGNRYLNHGRPHVYNCHSDSVEDWSKNPRARPGYFDMAGDTAIWEELKLLTSILPGENYNAGILRFECVDQFESTLADITDSVKRILVALDSTGALLGEIILSKSHGIWETPVWAQLLEGNTDPTLVKLKSLKKEDTLHGSLPIPDNSALFLPQFQAGDKLCWEVISEDRNDNEIERYTYCDSISEVLGTHSYNVQRVSSIEGEEFLSAVSMWPIDYLEIASEMEFPSSSWKLNALATPLSGPSTLWQPRYSSTRINSQQVLEGTLEKSGYGLSTSCFLGYLYAYVAISNFESWKGDTYAGLSTFYNSYSNAEGYSQTSTAFTVNRIGSIIDGIETGQTKPDSVPPIDILPVGIWPIPVKDILYISLPNVLQTAQIQVHNLNGQVLYEGPFEETLDVSGYHIGMYILTVQTDYTRTSKKFIKE